MVRYSPVGKYRTRQIYVWRYDRDVIDIFDKRGQHLAEAHREPDDASASRKKTTGAAARRRPAKP